jgi:hypothetical protein
MLVGVILGVFLTIAGTYLYDSSNGRVANGLSPTASGGQAPLVNWDVVDQDWQQIQANVQNMGTNLERAFKRHTG